MKTLDKAKQKIVEMGKCKSAFTVARATATACDQKYGVSLLRVLTGLDAKNKKLEEELLNITNQTDYNNAGQDEVVNWLSVNSWLEGTPRTI